MFLTNFTAIFIMLLKNQTNFQDKLRYNYSNKSKAFKMTRARKTHPLQVV